MGVGCSRLPGTEPWAAIQSLIEVPSLQSPSLCQRSHTHPLPNLKDSVTFEESKESPHQPKRACQKVSLLAASPVSLPTSGDSAFFSQEPTEEGSGLVLLPVIHNSAAGGLTAHSHSRHPPRDEPRGHRSESGKEKGARTLGRICLTPCRVCWKTFLCLGSQKNKCILPSTFVIQQVL